MTDKEMAEEYCNKLYAEKVKNEDYDEYGRLLYRSKEIREGFLAGLKAQIEKMKCCVVSCCEGCERLPKLYKEFKGEKMKVYIAGKITGENRASVAEKFSFAMCKLKSAGHLPFNPSVLPDYEDVDHEDYMHICFAMIDVCDAIYMLKDWQTSAGARAELQYAAEWRKKIMYEDESTREEGFPIVYGGKNGSME